MGIKASITNIKSDNLYKKGIKSLNNNDPEQAIEIFESIPEAASKYSEAMLYCARIYEHLEDY